MHLPFKEKIIELVGSSYAKTVINIIKGGIHSICVGALVGGGDAALNYLTHVHTENAIGAAVMTAISGTLYNAWREYRKTLLQNNQGGTDGQ